MRILVDPRTAFYISENIKTMPKIVCFFAFGALKSPYSPISLRATNYHLIPTTKAQTI